MQLVDQPVTEQTTERRHRAGQRHLEQSRLPVAAALAQDHQVAHVVWYLVRQHRQGGNRAQTQVGHKG